MRSAHGRGKRGIREVLSADVDLTPIMCLFIILVPLLLLSAVFERLASLEVSLPAASTLEETSKADKGPTGIVELRLLIGEKALVLEATLSHDPSGKEKDTYEDIRYEIPVKGEAFDLEALRQRLISLKAAYPKQEEIVFVVDDKVSYDMIVHTMDTCREQIYAEDGERKSRPLFPSIALSEAFVEGSGYEGIRLGTHELDRKLGYE